MNGLFAKPKEDVYGHNGMLYRMDTKWSKADPAKHPVNDCHEMVQDSKGRIILLTNETRNNVLIYNKSGKFLKSWGTEYPGAHGLTIQKNGGEDFLFITDTSRNQVFKTTIDGKVLLTVDYPAETGVYAKKELLQLKQLFLITESFCRDGYGSQYVIQRCQGSNGIFRSKAIT